MYGELDRGCGRCGRNDYTPAGKLDKGPEILRYCASCIKVCSSCGEAFKLDFFWPKKESQGFKEWSGSGQNTSAMAQFMLAGDYGTVCRKCQPFQVEPKVELPKPKPVERVVAVSVATDSPDALREQYEALFGRKL